MPDSATQHMQTKHLVITGRVQGVGFRQYVAFKARQFQITGWVRNRLDGSVEAVIHGTPENIAALIERARRGPPGAAVTSLIVTDNAGSHTAFVIRPTE